MGQKIHFYFISKRVNQINQWCRVFMVVFWRWLYVRIPYLRFNSVNGLYNVHIVSGVTNPSFTINVKPKNLLYMVVCCDGSRFGCRIYIRLYLWIFKRHLVSNGGSVTLLVSWSDFVVKESISHLEDLFKNEYQAKWPFNVPLYNPIH